MPCNTVPLTEPIKEARKKALDLLKAGLLDRSVAVVLSPNGSLAFRGWTSNVFADLCAYRQLAAENFAPLRQAIARAEALAGRRLNPAAVATGTHSHDGGSTWSTH